MLGGDGTILSTLRLFAGREVPVFAINFGAIGFLATVEPDELELGIRRALAGELDVMELPALAVATSAGDRLGVNDVSFHRRQDGRVAELAYSVEGEELGQVRCDGLVVSTPAGSTGYNLANGGPVLAWGSRASSSPSSPRTRSPRERSSWRRRTPRGDEPLHLRGRGDHHGRPQRRHAGGAGQHPGQVRAPARAAGSAAEGDLLPPPARQVRAALVLSRMRRPTRS